MMLRVLPSPPDTTGSNGSPPPDCSSPRSTPVRTSHRKRTANRRTLSCLPCRQHKLRCDRHVPCNTCSRYRREDQCRQHPAPSAVLEARTPRPRGSRFLVAAQTSASQSSKDTNQALQARPFQELTAARAADSSADSNIARTRHVEQLRKQCSTGRVQMFRFAEHWRQVSQSASQKVCSLESVPSTLYTQVFSECVPSSLNQVHSDPIDTNLFWKTHLAAVLPSQNQCDLLICYYLENSNWLYQAIHVPSFRHQYADFWASNVGDIDLIWLSLLFTLISISALHIPFELVEAIGFEQSTIRGLAHRWHSASRQALYAGEFESKPSLMQLQTFIATQLYWLSTKNIEAMNSYVYLMLLVYLRTLTGNMQCTRAGSKECPSFRFRQGYTWDQSLGYRDATTGMVGLVVL